ncbi:hypothetical protein PoB_004831100 [Plakobranchus ocellatus]|uniref:Uncharacterized protein n=1 Tax=Plakobranchus ocellatus TaxID=259542 RepID=A0AAV4BER2_9GAST|nr:hypothetical protein PoB_004831100 [Plakobranchus ocellatus]
MFHDFIFRISSPAVLDRASQQQGDLRLLAPLSGQGAGSGARTRNRRVPADLRADSLATVPPTPPAQLVPSVQNQCVSVSQ